MVSRSSMYEGAGVPPWVHSPLSLHPVFLKSLVFKNWNILAPLLNDFQLGLQHKAVANIGERKERDPRIFFLLSLLYCLDLIQLQLLCHLHFHWLQ